MPNMLEWLNGRTALPTAITVGDKLFVMRGGVLYSADEEDLPANEAPGDGVTQGELDSAVSDLTTLINAKAPIASPTFTGTVGGINKTMVGLGNVDNTSDANKPVSTAQQTALDAKLATSTATTLLAAKADLASPALTGSPTAPTAAYDTDTTQLATTAFVQAAKERITVQTAKTGNYVAVLADAGQLVRMNVASANTFTIPPNSSVAYPVGTVLPVMQAGAGTTTMTPGSGVTFRSRGGLVALGGQYAVCTATKIGTDEWLLAGDLA